MRHYQGHEFEALKMRYEDQVELLRTMTKLDIQVFSGYVTIQLALAAWFGAHGLKSLPIKIGMFSLDLAFSGIAALFLWSHYQRRIEAIETVKHLVQALGFTEKDVYLKGSAINAPATKSRPFWQFFVGGIIVFTLGIGWIIFT